MPMDKNETVTDKVKNRFGLTPGDKGYFKAVVGIKNNSSYGLKDKMVKPNKKGKGLGNGNKIKQGLRDAEYNNPKSFNTLSEIWGRLRNK